MSDWRYCALLGLLLAVPRPALAHTAWMEADPASPGVYRILFGGHAGQLEPLEPAKLTRIRAFDTRGEALPLQREDGEHGSRLTVNPDTALIALSYDNGIWARDRMGRSVNRPLAEVPGAVEATRALKFHKSILRWAPAVTEPLGQAFEVVPLSAQQPVAGTPMRVRVLVDGKPARGVRLGHGEEGEAGETDAGGVATFIPNPGFNRLWAGRRSKVDSATHTELSYEYLLAFHAAPPPA
jgi:nickel transport protein